MSVSISSPGGELFTIKRDSFELSSKGTVFFSRINKIVVAHPMNADTVGKLTVTTTDSYTYEFEYKFDDNGLIDYFVDCVSEENKLAVVEYSEESTKAQEAAAKKAAERVEIEKIDSEELARRREAERARVEAERLRYIQEKARIQEERKKEEERLAAERKREEERINRERATQKLKRVVSLNEGIKENDVAVKSKHFGDIFNKWGDIAFYLILIVNIFLCLISCIVGFIGLFENFLIFFGCVGGAAVDMLIAFIEAYFIRFVLKSVAQNYYAQAEVVQNTYISANVALYSANTTEE